MTVEAFFFFFPVTSTLTSRCVGRQAGAVCLPLADCFMCFEVECAACHNLRVGYSRRFGNVAGKCRRQMLQPSWFWNDCPSTSACRHSTHSSLLSLQLAVFEISPMTSDQEKEALCEIKIENDLIEASTNSCAIIETPSLNGRHCYCSQLKGLLCLCIKNELEPTVAMGFVSVAQVDAHAWVCISLLALSTFGEEHNTDC